MTPCIPFLKLLGFFPAPFLYSDPNPLQVWSHLAPPTIGIHATGRLPLWSCLLPQHWHSNGQKGHHSLSGAHEASVDPWAWIQFFFSIPFPLIASNLSLIFNQLTTCSLTSFPYILTYLFTYLFALIFFPSFVCRHICIVSSSSFFPPCTSGWLLLPL